MTAAPAILPETSAQPASPDALRLARELVKKFPECLWFRHPEAPLETREEVYLVIAHLREYGGHRAWKAAQRLRQCL